MTHKFMLAVALALLSSAPAFAQDSPAAFDSRWNPYLGCWNIVQDQRGQSAPVPAGTMVCVRPSGRFGVAVTTTVDGKNVLEQTMVADGSSQPLSQGDCSGTQTSNWSRDGERLFTAVELTCANRPKRTVSGITLLANGQWVDSQATLIDGNADVRLRRYRRTSDSYTGPAGMTTAPLSVEDIIEASAKVQSEALEAALDEANARFALNSRMLRQLADNGVSPNVIDLLVAQAYPEKFEVQRSGYPSASYGSNYGTVSMGSSSMYMGSTMYPSPMYDPFYSSYYYYSPFAYPYYWGPSYSYRYGSPFYSNYYNNYNYYGLGGGGYYGSVGGGGGRPRGDNAQPGDPDSRGSDGIATGRGYTRVRPSGSSTGTGESATPTSRTPGSSRGARSIGSVGSSDSSSSSSSSPSSSSGSSSSGSSSSGGSSDSGGGGGRTAQPR
ncbi:MAG TPA: hypothetical protein VM115_15040 [Vicinamibacterales bacterium]|nr:hypothetical protein [Vicinamibacterales bacterium]